MLEHAALRHTPLTLILFGLLLALLVGCSSAPENALAPRTYKSSRARCGK